MLEFLFTKTPLVFLQSSLWRDEAFSFLMAKLPLIQLFSATARDSNSPLYYVLLKGWIQVFGSSELSMRIPSLLFFWGTLYGGFLILKHVFLVTEKKSMLFLLFFLLNPVLHYYAFEARMYTMLAFFGTFYMYALLRDRFYHSSIWFVFGFLTHYLFLLLPFSACVTLWILRDKKRIGLFIRSHIFAVLGSLPWVLYVVSVHPQTHRSFWILPPSLDHFLQLPAIVLTGHEYGTWVQYPHLFIAGYALWACLWYGWRFFFVKHAVRMRGSVRYKLTLVTFVAIGVPLIVSLISLIFPIYSPRYLIVSTTFFLILVSVITNSTHRIVSVLVFSVICVTSITYAQAQITMRKKAPLRETFAKIIPEMGVGDVVYVTHEYDYHPAVYYLHEKSPVQLYKKTYEELPWYVGKVLIPPSATTQSLPVFPARAFIVQSDGTYSIQSRK